MVADSAYPAHSSPGVETIVCGSEHIEILRYLLESLSREPHLRPTVHLDSELAFLQESDAPGVLAFRTELRQVIGDAFCEQPHEEIISKLEHASRMFRVLVLKTDTIIPYSSAFLELQCRYWSEDAERRLQIALFNRCVQNPG